MPEWSQCWLWNASQVECFRAAKITWKLTTYRIFGKRTNLGYYFSPWKRPPQQQWVGVREQAGHLLRKKMIHRAHSVPSVWSNWFLSLRPLRKANQGLCRHHKEIIFLLLPRNLKNKQISNESQRNSIEILANTWNFLIISFIGFFWKIAKKPFA